MQDANLLPVSPANPETEHMRENQTQVYAIQGADPEVLAYAMAKYSRSALTMKESLAEISAQRAEQFLDTFYFQYGHRSIADLAHIPFAIERLSLLAAIELVDEQRWDGQERSTRYQNFRASGWYTPDFGDATPLYEETMTNLFGAYERIGSKMLDALKQSTPKPDSMKLEAYDRALKARAFDVARYLLPLGTNTSLGQIVNARTLETQISRLLSSEVAEVRGLGSKLRSAAGEPVWNVQHEAAQDLIRRIAAVDTSLADHAADLLLKPVRAVPTLVKYAVPSPYLKSSQRELQHAALALMAGETIESAPVVDLLEDEPLEVELATSLLYPHCHFPYRQIRRRVMELNDSQRSELIALGASDRGRHDELVRSFHSGGGLRFDIFMDIGGFRDMHRHRRCVQLIQSFSDVHGYEDPVCPGQPTLEEAGLGEEFQTFMQTAYAAYAELGRTPVDEAAISARYCLPLGTRCRALFKMDFAEAVYISELRSGAAGHFSYRRVAWEIYRCVAARHPTLSHLFRVSDVNISVDLLKR